MTHRTITPDILELRAADGQWLHNTHDDTYARAAILPAANLPLWEEVATRPEPDPQDPELIAPTE